MAHQTCLSYASDRHRWGLVRSPATQLHFYKQYFMPPRSEDTIWFDAFEHSLIMWMRD